MHQIDQQSMTLISIKPIFPALLLPTHKLNFKNNLISAKWCKKRSGSQASRKLILNSIAHIASTVKILPEPWDSLIRELCVFGGGSGGKFGFRKSFGGGDGNGRNRKKGKLGFLVVLLISSSLALWVVLEKEIGKENELFVWVLLILISAFVVYCLVKRWRREIKDWVLGFSCGAAMMMGLGLRNNQCFVRWIDGFKSNSAKLLGNTKKRRTRRWI